MGNNSQTAALKRFRGTALSCGLLWAFAAGAGAQQASPPYDYKIEVAQHRLVKLGYQLGTIDGRLGKQTVEALRTFQQDQALPKTGSPNKQTLEALERAAPGRIRHTRLTTQGLVGYLNQEIGKCRQDNPSAILANRMAHGLRLYLREDALTLRTSYEVTPYDESQQLLKAVKHGRRFRIAPRTVNIDSLVIETVDEQRVSPCYRLRIGCLEGKSCITEGYANQREALTAVFAAGSLDGLALRKTWHRLLSRLGAGQNPELEQGATEPAAAPATAPGPEDSQPAD